MVSTIPRNPVNLLEFIWSSWKFLCKMSMIDRPHWLPVIKLDRLFKKLVALFYLCHGPMLCISCFCYVFSRVSTTCCAIDVSVCQVQHYDWCHKFFKVVGFWLTG